MMGTTIDATKADLLLSFESTGAGDVVTIAVSSVVEEREFVSDVRKFVVGDVKLLATAVVMCVDIWSPVVKSLSIWYEILSLDLTNSKDKNALDSLS